LSEERWWYKLSLFSSVDGGARKTFRDLAWKAEFEAISKMNERM